MKYLVIVEKGAGNYSAYVPDLPGCASAGNTLDETLQGIREALEGHIALMRETGEPIPDLSSEAAFVEVPLAV